MFDSYSIFYPSYSTAKVSKEKAKPDDVKPKSLVKEIKPEDMVCPKCCKFHLYFFFTKRNVGHAISLFILLDFFILLPSFSLRSIFLELTTRKAKSRQTMQSILLGKNSLLNTAHRHFLPQIDGSNLRSLPLLQSGITDHVKQSPPTGLILPITMK